jgi:probable phosphoglycerate mutase
MITRLCIVRHGETDWNLERRIQGQRDIPLNQTGRAQALAVAYTAAHHRFDAIYSSDLTRAMDTARAIAEREGLEVRPLSGLRERHYGIFQGITATEGAELHPHAYARYSARDPDYDFESGESLHGFVARALAAVDWLVRHHSGQTLCAVSHGGVLDVLYRRVTGRPLQTPRDFTIPNCALNWFRIDELGWHLERWGDRHHLEHVIVDSPE